MAQLQWARLKGSANCGLRRGAWYRVVQLTSRDAVVDVTRKRVNLPRSALQFVSVPPRSWTVVPRPPDATGLATGWGATYAVCPSCRNRAPLQGSPQRLACPRCKGLFRV
ncbi:MAG TPA: hypothetical protein VH116_08400, partial [Gemmatimonadales bacterium]|nr:hypothetical protein [Gemmatimonadales bacterium]